MTNDNPFASPKPDNIRDDDIHTNHSGGSSGGGGGGNAIPAEGAQPIPPPLAPPPLSPPPLLTRRPFRLRQP